MSVWGNEIYQSHFTHIIMGRGWELEVQEEFGIRGYLKCLTYHVTHPRTTDGIACQMLSWRTKN